MQSTLTRDETAALRYAEGLITAAIERADTRGARAMLTKDAEAVYRECAHAATLDGYARTIRHMLGEAE